MRPVLSDEEVAKFRGEICRAAELLFARNGVEGVTMRQIAAELGCSATIAYRYFTGKEEILSAVRAAAFDRFSEVIEEATHSSADSGKSARNVGQAYLDFALQNPDAYRMMFDLSQSAVTGNTQLAGALARARRSMVAYVEPMIDRGMSRIDAQALGQMLWASTHGLVMLRLSGLVTGDAELRQLHKTTMLALVRGGPGAIDGDRAAGAPKRVGSVPPPKATRKPR